MGRYGSADHRLRRGHVTEVVRQERDLVPHRLALQKEYISLYINAAENGRYLAEARKDDLGKVKVGKSAVSFKKLDDLNLDVALDVVRRAADTA